ncbi:MAG: type VII toxin-antitoxin system HepT family RNase toxin [Pseudonocardiaceae bacterium]
MVDSDRVRRLLIMLERYRSLLAMDDPDPYRRRHLVQTAAQICIDLANHVIAADGHRVPRDYGDAFRVLAEAGVLDDELADRMVALAGARNLIVHLYAEVDDDRLARAVQGGGLDDLGAFATRIAALAAI